MESIIRKDVTLRNDTELWLRSFLTLFISSSGLSYGEQATGSGFGVYGWREPLACAEEQMTSLCLSPDRVSNWAVKQSCTRSQVSPWGQHTLDRYHWTLDKYTVQSRTDYNQSLFAPALIQTTYRVVRHSQGTGSDTLGNCSAMACDALWQAPSNGNASATLCWYLILAPIGRLRNRQGLYNHKIPGTRWSDYTDAIDSSPGARQGAYSGRPACF